jgi:tetratricopeptide (TPR) repeat protein
MVGGGGAQKVPAGMRAAGYYRVVLLAIAVAGIALQAAALGPLRDTFWGFHLYAFLPGWAAVCGWLAVAVATALLLMRPPGAWRRADTDASSRLDSVPTAWTVALLAVVCAVFFWVFRSDQTLLGDGLPLTIDLPRGQSFHPRQPLAMWLQQTLYRSLGGAFAGTGLIPPEVARRTVAVGSVVAGVLFALTAFGLGRAIQAGRPAEPASAGAARKGAPTAALLIASVLLCQGYAVLFYGYVENYTYYILTIAVYLLASMFYLKRRLPLSVPAAVLAVGIGVHLSSVSLVASFLFLAGWGLVGRDRRADAIAGLATLVAGVLLLDRLLGWLSPGYTLWDGLAQIFKVARTSQGGGSGLSYVFSWVHVRDFVNEHYLVGPLAAFLFVPALVYAVRRRAYRDPVAVFLTLAAGVYLAGSWAMTDPLLGYARDWDLFAPAAVCYTLAGLYFLVSQVTSSGHAKRLLTFALVLSLVHTAPWVWINHSEALTLERFKTLPLGIGRTEVVVGNWYMRNDNPAEAEAWFKRALKANPKNVNAYYLLGVLYASEGHIEPACDWFGRAVKLRPDKADYRKKYIKALFEAGRCYDAVPHLVWLAERQPRDYGYWQAASDDMIRMKCSDALDRVAAPLLEAAERRLKEIPGDIHANVFAGIMLGNMDRVEEALVKFERALETNPNLPAGLVNAGMALSRLGRAEESRSYLGKFIQLYPDHPMAGFVKQQLAPQSRD